MSGCDTTSAFLALSVQGEKKAFNLLQKNHELQGHVVKVFHDPTSSPDFVSFVREQFLLVLQRQQHSCCKVKYTDTAKFAGHIPHRYRS